MCYLEPPGPALTPPTTIISGPIPPFSPGLGRLKLAGSNGTGGAVWSGAGRNGTGQFRGGTWRSGEAERGGTGRCWAAGGGDIRFCKGGSPARRLRLARQKRIVCMRKVKIYVFTHSMHI